MAQRYVRFDADALARLAAEAVGSKSCVKMEKYSEHNYNEIFYLTMDDGKQAVAKIPHPNAGQPHFTTASEVATMDFVCLILVPLNSAVLKIHRLAVSWVHLFQRFMRGVPEPTIVL